MVFTVMCSYDGKKRSVTKDEAMEIVWKEACRIARDFEEKQNFNIAIQLENDVSQRQWIATLDIIFPKSCYYGESHGKAKGN